MAAIVKQGSVVCSGTRMGIDLGFVPDLVFAWLEGSGAGPVFWDKTSWCQRTQMFGPAASASNALIGMAGTRLQIGTNSAVNSAGATLHYLALANNGSGLFANTSWIGNNVTRDVIIADGATSAAAFVLIKRDSTKAPAVRFTGMTNTALCDGSATSTVAIRIIRADGTLEIGSLANVNELALGSTGEGHACIAAWQSAGLVEVVSWSGDANPARTIGHTVADPKMAIVVPAATGTPSAIKMASMGTVCAKAGGASDAAAVTSLVGGIQLGDATYNASGVSYFAIVIGQSDGAQVLDEIPADLAAKAVLLTGGSGSYVDCGTDNSLSMAGAYSLEWWGELRVTLACNSSSSTTGPSKVGYLMARSYGDEGRADSDGLANAAGTRRDGTWSWGIMSGYVNDLLDWSNPQFQIVTTNYCNAFDAVLSQENSVRTKPWRTGILIPRGPFHVLVTANGSGLWRLYLNGDLVKQRQIDMTTVTLADDLGFRVNAGAGSGHRTVFGARQGDSAIERNERLLMLGASVYSIELTPLQAKNMYRRQFLRDTTIPDITPTERWLADSANGGSLPAQINVNNSGAISGGAVVLRDNWIDRRFMG